MHIFLIFSHLFKAIPFIEWKSLRKIHSWESESRMRRAIEITISIPIVLPMHWASVRRFSMVILRSSSTKSTRKSFELLLFLNFRHLLCSHLSKRMLMLDFFLTNFTKIKVQTLLAFISNSDNWILFATFTLDLVYHVALTFLLRFILSFIPESFFNLLNQTREQGCHSIVNNFGYFLSHPLASFFSPFFHGILHLWICLRWLTFLYLLFRSFFVNLLFFNFLHLNLLFHRLGLVH